MPTVFVACAPGLEALLGRELSALGLGRVTGGIGGVTLRGGKELIYRLNLEAGLALKVLVRLGRFEARHWSQLEQGLAAVPWQEWLSGVPSVRVQCKRSKLYHSGAVAERVTRAIGARMGTAPSPSTLLVRLVRDRCTISLDTSGSSLPRRGYRRGTGKAPLRSDLARALVIGSGWDRKSPLCDPMCGSGTILIEAGFLAMGRAPGIDRDFAFEGFPNFDAELWARLRERARAREQGVELRLVGSDRDAGAVASAVDNAARAGIDASVTEASLSASPIWSLSGPGTLCTNPPWGRRVSSQRDLRPLLQQLAKLCRQHLNGWQLALAVADPRLVVACGLPATPWCVTDHGGTKVALTAGVIDPLVALP